MNGKVTVVNANSLICGPKVCAPVVGNVLVFGDRHHLTGPTRNPPRRSWSPCC